MNMPQPSNGSRQAFTGKQKMRRLSGTSNWLYSIICGSHQPHSEKTLRVVFCVRCGGDFPVKALACMHCGLQNPMHPLVAKNTY